MTNVQCSKLPLATVESKEAGPEDLTLAETAEATDFTKEKRKDPQKSKEQLPVAMPLTEAAEATDKNKENRKDPQKVKEQTSEAESLPCHTPAVPAVAFITVEEKCKDMQKTKEQSRCLPMAKVESKAAGPVGLILAEAAVATDIEKEKRKDPQKVNEDPKAAAPAGLSLDVAAVATDKTTEKRIDPQRKSKGKRKTKAQRGWLPLVNVISKAAGPEGLILAEAAEATDTAKVKHFDPPMPKVTSDIDAELHAQRDRWRPGWREEEDSVVTSPLFKQEPFVSWQGKWPKLKQI